MKHIDQITPDITHENIERLIELFPAVATEVADAEGNPKKSIDFDALRDLLGDVAEGQRERYQFTWPGKAKAKLEARTPTTKTMRPCPEKSVDWDTTENLYIEGDNLEALKIMRETYAGKVKLIYIDPPYNTGHDFIYDDDFAETHAEYIEESGEYDEEGGRLVANPESNGRFHSDWCSMMYPRLLLARDLLADDGAIFISIDDNEQTNLKKLCDEVFDSSCFVSNICWQKVYSPKNNNVGISSEVEYLVCYSKKPNWAAGKLERTEKMNSMYKNPDNDPYGKWTSSDATAPGAASHQGMVYAIQSPFTGELFYPTRGCCWRKFQNDLLEIMNGWASYKLQDLNDADERAAVCGLDATSVRQGVKAIVLDEPLDCARDKAQKVYESGVWPLFYFTNNGQGGLRKKTYLNDMAGRTATNLWTYDEVGHNDEAKKELASLFGGHAPFDTPKPVRLLEQVLKVGSTDNCIVMDFFSGSATLAQAVMSANEKDGGQRKYVLIQLQESSSYPGYETLCETGEERIRRAGAKIREEVDASNQQLRLGEEPKETPDLGFRVLRIDDSCMNDTYATPGETTQATLEDLVDNLRDDSSALDLLFEVLPKFRIPYSAKIKERHIGGGQVFDVNEGQLLACFDQDVSTETIGTIAKEKPLYAVFRDASFKDDSAVANLEELFKTFSPDTVRRVI